MNNPFKNTSKEMLDAINSIINEQNQPQALKALNIGGRVAQTIDFTMSTDDPDVYLKGLGTLPLSMIKKLVKQDLIRFADKVGVASSKELISFMIDIEGKKTNNPFGQFAYRLHGLAEIEEFLSKPETKRKIALMKKKSGIV